MSSQDSFQLRRVLGLAFGMAVVVGGTIGQGILRAPGLVAQGVPDPSWMLGLWALGALAAAIDAMSTVELAGAVPVAGGPYAFSRRVFGPSVGLATGLTDWLGNVGGIAFVSVVFAEYVHRLGLLTALPLGALAALLPLALGAIQWFGTKVAGRSQEVGSAVKAMLFLALIAALALSPRGAPVVAEPMHPVIGLAGTIMAIRTIYGAYYGWNGAAYFCEEVKDPGRSIARATFTGIAAIAAIYILMNVACLQVLSVPEMANSKLVAADAAGRAFGPAADTVVTLVSLVAVATVTNALVMIFPRVLFSIGRDAGGLAGIDSVAPNGTPRVALVLTAGLGALLATAGAYDLLLAFSAVLLAAMSMVINAAAFWLRIKEPELPRAYRMPFFPLPALFAFVLNGLLLVLFIYDDPKIAGQAFLLLALIVAVVSALLKARGREVSPA